MCPELICKLHTSFAPSSAHLVVALKVSKHYRNFALFLRSRWGWPNVGPRACIHGPAHCLLSARVTACTLQASVAEERIAM